LCHALNKIGRNFARVNHFNLARNELLISEAADVLKIGIEVQSPNFSANHAFLFLWRTTVIRSAFHPTPAHRSTWLTSLTIDVQQSRWIRVYGPE